MYSKAKIAGHPIHPMIVAFPITFYTTALVAFGVYEFFSGDLFWYRLGFFSTFAGVGTALIAAVPGFIDWAIGIPKESAAKARGLLHMALNVSALLLFAISAVRIWGSWETPIQNITGLFILSLGGVFLTAVGGFHGWELIATHKVGVTMTPEQERLEPAEKMDRHDHEVSPRPRMV